MTEQIDTRYSEIDLWPTRTSLEAIWESQLAAIAAIGPAIDSLSIAVDLAVARLSTSDTGRLAYVGAGTSIRTAVQDGTELGPTFDWPDSRSAYLIAGGPNALMHSVEGAEDDEQDAVNQVQTAGLGPQDVLIGIAASGNTPFTIAALRAARAAGALTIGIANNPDTPVLSEPETSVLVYTGSELIAGSTRMKAGSAQKVILNMISTQVMIGLGRVYQGLMVDMRADNIKLRARAIGMVRQITNVNDESAESALNSTGWKIKQAALVALGQSPEEAVICLNANGDNLRTALRSKD